MLLPILSLVMLFCVIIGFLFLKTTDTKGVVNNKQTGYTYYDINDYTALHPKKN